MGDVEQTYPNSNIVLTQTIKMPQSREEFNKMAISCINYKFSGDPLKLKTFLNDVDYLNEITETKYKGWCVKFVKKCLEGKALEAMPDDIDSLADIKTRLTQLIKFQSSEIIESKILSLRVRKGDLIKFFEEAEKLAESLRRSLIAEGDNQAKAEKSAIKRTIELCNTIY